MQLNPKERFLKSTHAKVFAEMVNQEAFKTALEYAFLEWSNTLKRINEHGVDPVSQAFKSEGIREFITVLFNLPEPNEEQPIPIRQNLKHFKYA